MIRDPVAKPMEAESPPQIDQDLAMVLIGASAGGIHAVADLLAEVDPDAPVVIIVAQHMAPQKLSTLPAILAAGSTLEVLTIEDGLQPMPRKVYVPPAGVDVRLKDGRFQLSKPPPRILPSPLIDALMESVVEEGLSAYCIAVIVSGLGMDGAEGVRQITQNGGAALAQIPASANSPDMPEAALVTGRVDAMASVTDLGKIIGPLACALCRPAMALTADELRLLDQVLSRWSETSLRRFDAELLSRTIALRTALRGLDSVSAYIDLLSEDASEAHALLRKLVKPVTSFNVLQSGRRPMLEALTKAYRQSNSASLFRAWSVGCASGEEAFAMAFELDRCCDDYGLGPYRVYGTDLLPDQVSFARLACYSRGEVAGLPEEQLLSFMVPRLRYFQIISKIRSNVLFTVHDALRNPPLPRIQFISCIGVAPRMRRQSQTLLEQRLLGALAPGGVLYLDGRSLAVVSVD